MSNDPSKTRIHQSNGSTKRDACGSSTSGRRVRSASKGSSSIRKTSGRRRPSKSGRRAKSENGKGHRLPFAFNDVLSCDGGAYGTVKRLLPIAGAVLALCIGIALSFSMCGKREVPDGPSLPAYITDDVVQAAMRMQDDYGHPAGCTIAQIIQESGAGDNPSALAERDHNLFGMKWNEYFEGKPGVVGPVVWDTNEEYDGQLVGISGTFIAFESDVACVEFRSSVFLQSERYRTNPVIQEAIETGSSSKMAEGLADAGWATDSSYAESLIALMDEYDLYRFDK